MKRYSRASATNPYSPPIGERLSFRAIQVSLAGTVLVLFAGCTTAPSAAERSQRQSVTQVGKVLLPTADAPRPVPPGADSTPEDFLRFALLHQPQVAAAYQDWRASVENIAPTRALPDPKLTFQADIARSLMSLMPGFMVDVMTPGKREAMANEATGESQVAYRAYVAALVQTATDLRRSWANLVAIDRSIEVRRSMIDLMRRMAESSSAGYQTGAGMPSLGDQSDALDGAHRGEMELAALEDRRMAARAQFKAALGLGPTDTDPAWPTKNFTDSDAIDDDTLWNRVLAANPDLLSMRAMVDLAEAQLGVAAKAGTPDFSAGLMADLKANPLMFRPTATLSLPVWREKISSILASAQARKLAARDRLDARKLSLATDLAQSLAMLRESDRMIYHVDASGFPTVDRDLASAEASLQTGTGDIETVLSLKLMKLDLRLERIESQRQRDRALADLIQMSAADLPSLPKLTANSAASTSQP